MQEKGVTGLVSVIIPCYNAAPYLNDTVESALKQSYPHLEVIVVDDGSTDNSPQIIESFSQHANFVPLKQANSGVSAARNTGIQHAKGEFIAFLDADDWMYPDNIAKKVHALANTQADVVYSRVEVCDEKLKPEFVADGADPANFENEVFYFVPSPIHSPSSAMVKRSALDEAGFFDTNLSTSADLDIWIRLSFHHKFARVNEPLVKYRLVPGSMNTNVAVQIRDMEYIFLKYGKNKQLHARLRRLKKAFYYSIVGNAYHRKSLRQFIKYSFKYVGTIISYAKGKN